MKIKDTIKGLRKELKLTQREFASRINVHTGQLLRYEKGQSTPSVQVLKRIADFCEVSMDYLIDGHDEKLIKKTKIHDFKLLEILRRVDKLKRPQRDQLKWAIEALLDKKQ